ncbi:hypothetical protein [Frateuria sp. YIM B11624]|uniref:hypothetical protein n=1 Tax=Frateuria sp. YIM B11624 TaxID=3143185 RepID=UPI003C76F208
MSTCPNCGGEELQELGDSSNAYCTDCDEVVEPVDDAEALGEFWCDTCGDMRPVDDDLCCLRCGDHV